MGRSLDDRFTDLADRVTTGLGSWRAFAVALVGILVWASLGPAAHFSDTWQLVVNTTTTIITFFVGFLILAASNRSERRNRALHAHLEEMHVHLDALVEAEEVELRAIEAQLAGVSVGG